MMREQLRDRRDALAAEYEQGAALLGRMDRERETLAQNLLRISGAVQVLDEMLRTFAADETRVTGAAAEGGEDGGNH